MKTIRRFRHAAFALILSVPFTQLTAQPSPLAGDWLGTLRIQSMSLRIVFHVAYTPEGGWKASMDSPDQGATNLPVDRVSVEGSSVVLGSTALGAEFRGTMQPGDSVIDGTWSQSGMTFPLRLARQSEKVVVRRPQHPIPPFPYRTEEVTFRNDADNVSLAGTLTLPRGAGPSTGVVLVSGSGPQDRDETVFNHKPFLVLADHLTRAGIAVLRYDDRGVGASTGMFSTATTADLARDAASAVAYLRSRTEIDPMKVGIAGHSEGGLIAPMVATGMGDVDFIVLLAAPSLTGAQIVLLQDSLISMANGVPAETISLSLRTNREIFRVLAASEDTAALRPRISSILASAAEEAGDSSLSPAARERGLERTVTQLLSPWTRFFLSYDPYPALTKVSCPVLALYGDLDLQVPPRINGEGIRRALAEGGHQHGTIRYLPGLNHLFQPATTGSPSEYARIETTMAPEALGVIATWITDTMKGH